jgi:cytochrome c-type biogenesis protein CcsB
METLVKLSFYCFTATTIAITGSSLCYIASAIGRVRIRMTTLRMSDGSTVVGPATEHSRAPAAFGSFGTMLAWFGLVFQALALLFRVLASKSAPSNMYEFSLVFVFAITLIYLLFERSYGIKHLGAIVMPLAVGMALYIWLLPADVREVNPLIPALQNQPLMTAHVSLAIFAYAAFAVSFASALLFLIAQRWRVSWLPSATMLDDIGYRAVTIGFPMMALVLILGSVWAYRAWGTYWSWDPKETSALFLWLVYGVYLHTRSLRGWRGTRSAVVLILGFAAVIFTYYGNYFFGGLHAYGGV